MEFNISPRNEEGSNFASRLPPPLKAKGNLSYLQFISLLKHIWEEGHPDIPMRPVQSNKFSRYPVIIYSLQNRTPFHNEPKQKFRELQYKEDTNLITQAQRFNNIIIFKVVTETNPELCEAVIETFEDFMLEFTGYLKEFGVSDMFYVRRLPDGDQTRPDGDIDERSVAYNVILEKIRIHEVAKIQQIIVKARVMLDRYWQNGTEFWVFEDMDDPGSGKIYAPGHVFKFGDIVKLLLPGPDQDSYAEGASDLAVRAAIPEGLSNNYAYQIIDAQNNFITLQNLNGAAVHIRSTGMGVLTGVDSITSIPAALEDNFQSATPSY